MTVHSPIFTDEEKTNLGIIPEEEIEKYIDRYYAEKEHDLHAAVNIYGSYIAELDPACICSFCVPLVNPSGLSVLCELSVYSASIIPTAAAPDDPEYVEE